MEKSFDLKKEGSQLGGHLLIGLGFAVVALAVIWLGMTMYQSIQRQKDTTRVIRMWADKLDGMTYDTGVYKKPHGDDVNEGILEEAIDGWGNPLRYQYTMGGIVENVKIMSSGKDGQFYTGDDLVTTRMSGNLKGIGTGIKKNIEETAHNAGKGIVTGMVEGGKEAGVIVFTKAKEGAVAKVEDTKEGFKNKASAAKDKMLGWIKRDKAEDVADTTETTK